MRDELGISLLCEVNFCHHSDLFAYISTLSIGGYSDVE